MSAPFAGGTASVKGAACISSTPAIASSTVPQRTGTTAQRIRIGLTGLAFAFLLILLGTILIRSSREAAPPTAAEQNAEMNQPSEPLAELGVAPGADQNQQAPANSSGK
ncbi:MAG TPA: hypothetical protein VFT61_10935 [Sphingomicrobium sp.]|nr:hypothetical protein [Sphingomicrobium sp.]